MTRRILSTLAVAALLFVPAAPAYADRGRGDERSRCGGGESYDSGDSYGCDDYGGQGNNNRRREDYGGAGCKYVCPSFDKSPVHDAFNFSPFICMPGATCYEDGDKRGKDQPPAEGQQPASSDADRLECMIRSVPFHCDPKPQ